MNKNESATQEIAGHLEAFFYRVPKKNHDAIVKNLKAFVPWFEKNGVRIEYFQFAGAQNVEGMPMLAIDKALSATEDEEIWVELQYYSNRKHCEDTFAKMMQDKSIEPLGNEFFGLITKGSSLVTGGFSRLGAGDANQAKSTKFTYPSDREVVIERVFDAPAERLFKVITDPNLVPNWWGPRRFATVVDKDDVRPGGVWRYINRAADGSEYAFNGVYREIVPAKRIVRTFEFEGAPGHVSVETATFEEQGGKTKMRASALFQTAEDLDGMVKSGMEEGASETWDRLAELVAAMKPGIRIEHTFKASPEKVWEMWTTKEGIEKWSASHPWVAKVKHLDVRPGGSYENIFTDGKQDIRNHGSYVEVVPAKRLAWIDVFDMLPDVKPYNTYAVMELQQVAGGTKVTFVSSALHSEEWTRMCTEGWTTTFGQLAKVLEK